MEEYTAVSKQSMAELENNSKKKTGANTKKLKSDIFYGLNQLEKAYKNFDVTTDNDSTIVDIDKDNARVAFEEFIKAYKKFLFGKSYILKDKDKELVDFLIKYGRKAVEEQYSVTERALSVKIQRISHRFWLLSLGKEDCPEIIEVLAKYSNSYKSPLLYNSDKSKCITYKRLESALVSYTRFFNSASIDSSLGVVFDLATKHKVDNFLKQKAIEHKENNDDLSVPENIEETKDYYNALLFVATYSVSTFNSKLNELDDITLRYVFEQLASTKPNNTKTALNTVISSDLMKTLSASDNFIKQIRIALKGAYYTNTLGGDR